MFHIELRQFPHNACRFNLGDDEVRAVVDLWVRDRVVDFGERKWSPHQARLTILEGPHLDTDELTMGRGWQNAQHKSEDVTERVLGLGRQAALEAAEAADAARIARAAAAQNPQAGPAAGAPADPLAFGVQIASLLGSDPSALLDAWRAAALDAPGLTPSESLALAEQNLRSAAGASD